MNELMYLTDCEHSQNTLCRRRQLINSAKHAEIVGTCLSLVADKIRDEWTFLLTSFGRVHFHFLGESGVIFKFYTFYEANR